MYNVSDPLDEFLNKPRQYLLQYLKEKPRFDMNLNMAKNGNPFLSVALSTLYVLPWHDKSIPFTINNSIKPVPSLYMHRTNV